MDIKETIVTDYNKTELPNVNIRSENEKGFFGNIKNMFINMKISNILGKSNKIIKTMTKAEKLNNNYEKKILKIRDKFLKKAVKNDIKLQELKKQHLELIDIQNKKDSIKLFKEPLLFLLRDNMELEIYENIKTGWFDVPNMKKKRLIYLDTNNTFKVKLFNSEYRTLVHHVDETFDYPTIITHNSEQTTAIILLTWAQAKDEDNLENKKKFTIWDYMIWALIGVVVIVALIYGLPYILRMVGVIPKEVPVQYVQSNIGAVDMNSLPTNLNLPVGLIKW